MKQCSMMLQCDSQLSEKSEKLTSPQIVVGCYPITFLFRSWPFAFFPIHIWNRRSYTRTLFFVMNLKLISTLSKSQFYGQASSSVDWCVPSAMVLWKGAEKRLANWDGHRHAQEERRKWTNCCGISLLSLPGKAFANCFEKNMPRNNYILYNQIWLFHYIIYNQSNIIILL